MAIEQLPDLILCDVMMPIMDGYEVVVAVRKERKLAETPFIFLSAKSQKSDMRRGMDLGADDYLTKPFKAQELFDAVETRIWLKEAGSKELQDTRDELEKLNQQMVAISEADIPVAMIISDLRGTIVHFSRGAQRLLGYAASEMVNRKPISVLHRAEEITERANALTRELGFEVNKANGFLTEIPNRQSFESREWTYVRKDRTTLPVQLVVSTIRDSGGTITGYLGVAIDISERKAAEAAMQFAKEQAEKANRMKSQFLANMSHEIRTPMNSILGFSDILMNLVQEPQARKYLSTIVSSGRTLMAIINDLLDLAKIEAGKMQLRPEPVDIGQLVAEVGQMFMEQLRARNVELKTEVSGQLNGMLELDDVRLRQILINLVGNAAKFTHHGYVRLAVDCVAEQEHGHTIKIEVQDTGIGISEENQNSIFESFQQVHDTNTTQYGGTGLGLSITRRLVDLMGGSIKLTSEKGVGSTFCVTLPNVKFSALKSDKGGGSGSGPSGIQFHPATVLVVDDVPSNRDLIVGILAGYPLRVVTAHDGRDALIKAEALRPDLILMDLRMPEMDGWEAARRIREMDNLRNVRIVACTASLMASDPVGEMFDDVVHKPLDTRKLIEVLAEYLPHSKSVESTRDVSPEQPADSNEPDDQHGAEYEHLDQTYAEPLLRLADALDVNEMENILAEMKAYAAEHGMSRLLLALGRLSSAVENFNLDLISDEVRNLLNLIRNGH